MFLEDKLPEELGWIALLTPSHQRLFAGEVYAAATSGSSPKEIIELIDSWKATAELDGAPDVLAQIERNRSRQFLTEEEWRAGKQATR